MQIILSKEESEKIFYSSLCNAVGTNYMRGYGLEIDYNTTDYDKAKAKLENPVYEDILMQILRDGNELKFVDEEGDNEWTRSITLKDVYERMELVPLINLTNIIVEQDDVYDADIVLQTIFFKEVVFG